MKALIIDDSRAMRSILRGILADLGLEVVEASDGSEAVGLLEGDPSFDLALVDWNLPEMSGLEVVNRVRSDSRFDQLKLLMVTTETELQRVVQALEAGANEYIMKPFDREMLLEKLVILGLSVEE